MEAGMTSDSKLEARDHLCIGIIQEDHLVSSIKEKMDSISHSHCACRVPEKIIQGFEVNYHPHWVSIGPYHHGNEILQSMEAQKWRYLNSLLSRKPNAEAVLHSCLKAIKPSEQKARKFYGEMIPMGSEELVQMMLIDGCFIIELFLKFAIKSLRRRDDPCFSTSDALFNLRCDLILLENQIPFFILQELFGLVPIPAQCNMSLMELALCFFRKLIPGGQVPPGKFDPDIHHLLDIVRQHYLPTIPEIKSSEPHKKLRCATHLKATGIIFRKAMTESPLNIKFLDGELEIPPLKIHDYTEILFRNIIAMELCNGECKKYMASYAHLMERLTRRGKDVALLQRKGILECGPEKEQGISCLFKKLSADIDLDDFYYGGLCEKVKGYHPRTWKVWYQNMKHAYHRTHLGVAGFFLAVLLLVLIFTLPLFLLLSFLLHRFH